MGLRFRNNKINKVVTAKLFSDNTHINQMIRDNLSGDNDNKKLKFNNNEDDNLKQFLTEISDYNSKTYDKYFKSRKQKFYISTKISKYNSDLTEEINKCYKKDPKYHELGAFTNMYTKNDGFHTKNIDLSNKTTKTYKKRKHSNTINNNNNKNETETHKHNSNNNKTNTETDKRNGNNNLSEANSLTNNTSITRNDSETLLNNSEILLNDSETLLNVRTPSDDTPNENTNDTTIKESLSITEIIKNSEPINGIVTLTTQNDFNRVIGPRNVRTLKHPYGGPAQNVIVQVFGPNISFCEGNYVSAQSHCEITYNVSHDFQGLFFEVTFIY